MRLRDLLLSQFHESWILTTLVDRIDDIHIRWIGMLHELMLMSDINRPVGYWLDMIGKIVGRNRYIDGFRKNYFGFSENNDKSFGIAPFWSGYPDGVVYTSTVDDLLYRKLLWAQVAYNSGNVTIAGLVYGLSRVFDNAPVHVVSSAGAHVRVRIRRHLTVGEKTLLGKMPVCIGAGIEVDINDFDEFFGFSEQRYFGFDEGTFWDGEGKPSRNALANDVRIALTAATVTIT